jgi:hypothetical protein
MNEDGERENPAPKQTWRHYKGGEYLILCLASETDTGLPYVVYQAVAGGKIWARLLYRFMSRVTNAEHPEPGVWRYVNKEA